jgi:DNA-binding response OmpR family regulator
MRHVLLLEHDLEGARWIEGTFSAAGWDDILLWQEPTLSRGLLLMELCEFSLVLVSSPLADTPPQEMVRILRRQGRDAPIVVLRESRSEGRTGAHLPEGVRAVVHGRDRAALFSTLHSILDKGEDSE